MSAFFFVAGVAGLLGGVLGSYAYAAIQDWQNRRSSSRLRLALREEAGRLLTALDGGTADA